MSFLSFPVLLDRKIQVFRPAGSLSRTFLLCQVMSLDFFILTTMPRGLWTFNFSLGEDFSLLKISLSPFLAAFRSEKGIPGSLWSLFDTTMN